MKRKQGGICSLRQDWRRAVRFAKHARKFLRSAYIQTKKIARTARRFALKVLWPLWQGVKQNTAHSATVLFAVIIYIVQFIWVAAQIILLTLGLYRMHKQRAPELPGVVLVTTFGLTNSRQLSVTQPTT